MILLVQSPPIQLISHAELLNKKSKTCKGIPEYITTTMTHEMYKNAIRNNLSTPITYKIIKNDKGQVITTSIKKQGLRLRDIKRH